MVAHLPDDGTPSLLGILVLLQHAGLDELVDELLHGIEGREEALRRHDDAIFGFGGGSLTVFLRLKRDEVEADHAACEMDLADAVRENFFLVCHCRSPVKFWEASPQKNASPKGSGLLSMMTSLVDIDCTALVGQNEGNTLSLDETFTIMYPRKYFLAKTNTYLHDHHVKPRYNVVYI